MGVCVGGGDAPCLRVYVVVCIETKYIQKR